MIIPNPTSTEKKQETEHRYLQTLIKKMAESRGYKASIEEPTPDGKGRVDVSLERNGKHIAVEIKDTTTDDWELQNIEKCLRAGYNISQRVPGKSLIWCHSRERNDKET